MTASLTFSSQMYAMHRTVLNNGIVVLVKENPAADIIAARLFVRAGSRWETPQQAGLSHLVSAVLTKGTDRCSSFEIAEQIETVGASLAADSTTDYFLLSLKTVSADFPAVLKLAGELVRSPSFPEQELELERRLTMQAIRSQQEQPFTIAFDQLRQTMYGQHPYALSSLGTEATIAQLQRDDLCSYHQTHFRPDNLVISLCGRIDISAAIALIQEIFGDWQAPAQPLPTLSLPPIVPNPIRVGTAQDTQQSIVMLGYLAPAVSPLSSAAESSGASTTAETRSIADYIALKLLNSYLGNGLSSRLFIELREKRGLAYEVSAFYPTRLDMAQFVVYMGTAPSNTATALEGLQSEIDRLRNTPLSPDELQTAKNKLLGQYALGKQTNAQIAQTFGWYETLGLGIEFDVEFQVHIAEMTIELAQAAAAAYLEKPSVAIVGPAAAVEPLLAQDG